jgi:hypothetical protein
MNDQSMDDKITIIEGPPPTFETAGEGWTSSLYEGPLLSDIAITRLRTFNGPALIERCNRAWRHQSLMHLEFRGIDGLENTAPILAARALEVDDGQMLLLWVRLEHDESEIDADADDDEFDDDDEHGSDDDPGYPGH